MTPDADKAGTWRAGTGLAAGVFVFAFLVALHPLRCYDVWWHMANGREVVEGRGIPRTNLYSFTYPDYEVTPTHWLFGVGAYLVHAAAGPSGLVVGKALLVAACFALAYLLARRRGAGGIAAALVVALACLASRKRFLERPHLFTMLGLAAFALLIERFRAVHQERPPRRHGQRHVHHGGTACQTAGLQRAGIRKRTVEVRDLEKRASVPPWLAVFLRRNWPLLSIPPLAALWANLHAGCLFGVGLVALEATGEAVSWLASRVKKGPADPAGVAARRRALLLAATAVAGAAAVMASPAGWGVYTYNLWHLRVGSAVPLVEFGWSTPLAKPLFYILLVGGAAVLAAERRRVRPGDVLAFAAFGALAVYAVRAIPNFAVVASPAVAVGLSSLWRRLKAREDLAERADIAARVARVERVVGASAGVALLVAPFALHFVLGRDMGLGLRRDYFPVEAADFVAREVESARAFNDFASGGYLAWRWYPRRRIFVDGRTNAYDPGFLRELYGPERVISAAFVEDVFARYDVNCALLLHYRHGNPFWPAFGLDRWAVVHADERALVLLRRNAMNAETIARHEMKLGPRGEAALSTWFARRGNMNSGRASTLARRGQTEAAQVLELRSRADALRAGSAAGRALHLEAAAARAPPARSVRVAAVQFHSIMGDVKRNRERLVPLIERSAEGGAKIVVLPEAAVPGYADLSTDTFWSSEDRDDEDGYLPARDVAESVPGPSVAFFAPLTRKLGICLTVPVIEADGGRYYNTVVLLGPDGEVAASHRKHAPWTVADTSWMTAGPKRATTVDTEHGRLGLMICYDMHALLRLLGQAKADIVLHSVAFHRPNAGEWFENTLARKAKDAGVALVLANWTFPNDPGWSGWGHSCVIGRDGSVLARAPTLTGTTAGDSTGAPPGSAPGDRIVFADVALGQRVTGTTSRAGPQAFDEAERAQLRFRLGLRERLLGRPRDAAKHFHAALEARPDWIEAHVNLGLALVACGEAALARKELEWVVEARPRLPEALLGLAEALEKLGLKAEAATRYREFLDTGGGRPVDAEKARKRLEALGQ